MIASHSLGGTMVSSAIVDHGLKAGQFFMANAAVAREAFNAVHADGQAHPIIAADKELMVRPQFPWKDEATGGLLYESNWASNFHQLIADQDDNRSRLTWRGRFGNIWEFTTPVNYYSSQDEVLLASDGNVPGDLDVAIFNRGRRSFVKQEMEKGHWQKSFVQGKKAHGGWKTNPEWEPTAKPEEIILKPYHYPFTPYPVPFKLDPATTDLVSVHDVDEEVASEAALLGRAYLLANDVPALSHPAGGSIVLWPGENGGIFPYVNGQFTGVRNIDMATSLAPPEGWFGNFQELRHGSIRSQPPNHTRRIYHDMVNRGILQHPQPPGMVRAGGQIALISRSNCP